MLHSYYQENIERLPVAVDFDLYRCWNFLKNMLSQEECISYMSDDGVVIGNTMKPWFSETMFANSLVWYVKPEARNGLLARSLIREFDKEAARRGAKYSHLSLDNPINIDIIDPFIKKLGYRDYSKIYMRDLDNG